MVGARRTGRVMEGNGNPPTWAAGVVDSAEVASGVDATILVALPFAMASITLKEIPERVHRDFKRRARANRRSLQAEIIRTLEDSLGKPGLGEELSVAEVAGMLKPKRKGVSVAGMHAAIERETKRQWKGR